MADPTPRKPKLLRSLVLIIVLVGAGAGVGGVLYAVREEAPRRPSVTQPPLVDSLVVREEDVVERFVGFGTAVALRRANLAAEVAATVIERTGDVRAGSPVVAGQVLVRLDDRQYRYVLARAEALAEAEQAALDELAKDTENLKRLIHTAGQELRVAGDERTRVSELFERGLAAKKEYDFANLAYQQARRVLQGYEREIAKAGPRQARLAASKRAYDADAELARLNIEKCEIRAPFAARIESLFVDEGDHVAPGSVVLALVDASRVEMAIQLPASVYNRVRVGAPCRLVSESVRGVVWDGALARIVPVADRQTRTFAAYVVVDNTERARPLLPGTFAKALIEGPTYAQRLVVPRRACRAGQVFVVEDGLATARRVTTERLIEDRAIVTGDLQGGDRIILSHLEQLADGTPVRIRPALSAAPRPKDALQRDSLGSSP